jgi:CrcB protein
VNAGVSPGVYAAVAAGGAFGGMLRVLVLAAWAPAPGGLPLALLGVNAAGSCLIGLVLAFSEPGRIRRLPPGLSVGLMAGFCGALTTFSTFSVELLSLEATGGVLYLAVSLVCWLGAAAIGLVVGRRINRPPEGGCKGNCMNRRT